VNFQWPQMAISHSKSSLRFLKLFSYISSLHQIIRLPLHPPAHKMVSLSEVQSSNSQIASNFPSGLVAVFVGATSGIGFVTFFP
jgi:hypothetical protein